MRPSRGRLAAIYPSGRSVGAEDVVEVDAHQVCRVFRLMARREIHPGTGTGEMKTRQWDEGRCFQALERQGRPQETRAARQILDWGRARKLPLLWGWGPTYGTFSPLINGDPIVRVYSDGILEVWFG